MCDAENAAALLSLQVSTYVDEAVKVLGISGGGGPNNYSVSSSTCNGTQLGTEKELLTFLMVKVNKYLMQKEH